MDTDLEKEEEFLINTELKLLSKDVDGSYSGHYISREPETIHVEHYESDRSSTVKKESLLHAHTKRTSSHPKSQPRKQIWIRKDEESIQMRKILLALNSLEVTMQKCRASDLSEGNRLLIKDEFRQARKRIVSLDTHLDMALLQGNNKAKINLERRIQSVSSIAGEIITTPPMGNTLGSTTILEDGVEAILIEVDDDYHTGSPDEQAIDASIRLRKKIKEDFVKQMVLEACNSYDEHRKFRKIQLTKHDTIVRCHDANVVIRTQLEQRKMLPLCLELGKIVRYSKGTQSHQWMKRHYDVEFLEWIARQAVNKRVRQKDADILVTKSSTNKMMEAMAEQKKRLSRRSKPPDGDLKPS
jgi:hypothetical protein